MGALNKFLGKPAEIEIEGEKITIQPLRVKDMHLFSKEETDPQAVAKINKKILQLSIPDSTEEDIDNLPMKINVLLMEEINKLNGFTDERLDRITKNIK